MNRFLLVGISLLCLIQVKVYGQDNPKIRWVSVNVYTGNVELRWEPAPIAGVKYYTVRYGIVTSPTNSKLSWTAVDNVQIPATGDLFHSFDPSGLVVNPNSQSTVFAVKAHVSDAITSQVDMLDWDSTIYLKATFDSCLSAIHLSWNKYDFNMWDKGTTSYKIFISTDSGKTYTQLDDISPDSFSYTYRNLDANSNYRFYVSAISGNYKGDSATSNSISIGTSMARIPEYLHADFATYSVGNSEINFSLDTIGELNKYNLLRGITPDGPFDSIAQLKPENYQIGYTDNIDWNSGPYYYKLEALNYCNQPVKLSENTASTLVLSNTGDATNPALSWNSYSNWVNGVEQYTIERKLGDSEYTILSATDQTSYNDTEIQSMIGSNAPAAVCYRITASENNNPFGINNQSISNEICIELPVNFRFEYNAFTPGGDENSTFGPSFDFLPDFIEFEILDRKENAVFKSNDPDKLRWDGKINGKFAPAGAYMYVLQYAVAKEKKHVIRGGLVVVYP